MTSFPAGQVRINGNALRLRIRPQKPKPLPKARQYPKQPRIGASFAAQFDFEGKFGQGKEQNNPVLEYQQAGRLIPDTCLSALFDVDARSFVAFQNQVQSITEKR